MNRIRKTFFIMLIGTITLTVAPVQRAESGIAILEIIRQGVKKVIKAVDLMIQRLQNKTIALQNAAKVLENKLSKLKLYEIAEWTERQRQLYKKYYDELWKCAIPLPLINGSNRSFSDRSRSLTSTALRGA